MNIEELREYCLSIKDAKESLPFDDVTLVIKVMQKMIAIIPLDVLTPSISLKCDPEKAIDLRENYTCVEPAWHMNKKYWNTISLNQDMDDNEIKLWIHHSLSEVVKKFPKQTQVDYWSA